MADETSQERNPYSPREAATLFTRQSDQRVDTFLGAGGVTATFQQLSEAFE